MWKQSFRSSELTAHLLRIDPSVLALRPGEARGAVELVELLHVHPAVLRADPREDLEDLGLRQVARRCALHEPAADSGPRCR